MSDYIASVDAGNAGTNAVLAKPGGGYKSYYEPSIRATVTGESLNLGKMLDMEYEYVDWNGHRYVTGDDVLRVSRRYLERHMGSNRYGNEFHQFLVAVALARLGVSKGTVNLTLFVPPGLHFTTKSYVHNRFAEDGGEVEIKLKGDKKPRKWRYDSVNVWPEGIGAVCCFVIDDQGDAIDTDVLDGEVVVLDIGAHTLDAIKMVDGNFNAETLHYTTWDTGGVHIHMREPILRVLKHKSEDFANITVDDVDRVIRLGLVSDDYTLTAGQYSTNVKPLVEKYRERYAEWIANNICDGVFGGFKGIKSVIVVGGGAALIEDYMKQWYSPKILDRKDYPSVKKIHPVDMNAVGGMRLTLMQIKNTKT